MVTEDIWEGPSLTPPRAAPVASWARAAGSPVSLPRRCWWTATWTRSTRTRAARGRAPGGRHWTARAAAAIGAGCCATRCARRRPRAPSRAR
eukprot:444079-Prymnesium_polylepis.1